MQGTWNVKQGVPVPDTIPYCLVLQTPIAPNFNLLGLVHGITTSPSFTRIVPLLLCPLRLPVNIRIDLKICLLTYRILSAKQPVYFPSIPHTSLPSQSLNIKQSNDSVGLLDQDQSRRKSISVLHLCPKIGINYVQKQI